MLHVSHRKKENRAGILSEQDFCENERVGFCEHERGQECE